MEKFYTYLDATACVSTACSYLSVGSGMRNLGFSTYNDILQFQFNTSSPFYNPQPGDISSWTRANNPMNLPQPTPPAPPTPGGGGSGGGGTGGGGTGGGGTGGNSTPASGASATQVCVFLFAILSTMYLY